MEHRSAASFPLVPLVPISRQIVHARPSGVNICSLQMKHRSAVSCSNGTIGTNGTNRQIVHARSSGVNIFSLQVEYRSDASFSNGANRKASLTNGDFFTKGSIGEGFLTIGICLCILNMCGMERYFPLRRTDLVPFPLEYILLDKTLKDYGKVAVLSAVSCFMERNLTHIYNYFKQILP